MRFIPLYGMSRKTFRCRIPNNLITLPPPVRGKDAGEVGQNVLWGVHGGAGFSSAGLSTLADQVPRTSIKIVGMNTRATRVNQAGFRLQVQTGDVVSTWNCAPRQHKQAETENTQPRKQSARFRHRRALPPSFSHKNDYLRELQVWGVVGLPAQVTPLPTSEDQTVLLHGEETLIFGGLDVAVGKPCPREFRDDVVRIAPGRGPGVTAPKGMPARRTLGSCGGCNT